MRNKIFLILSIIFFIFSFIFVKHYLSVFYFQNDINQLAVNVEAEYKNDIYACFNMTCDKMQYRNGIFSYRLNQQNQIFYNDKIDNIELISSKTQFKNIRKIDLFNSNKYYEILLDKNQIKDVQFQNKNLNSFKFQIKSSDKTWFQKVGIYFESLFYNWYFYIISYILLLIYLTNYQKRFDFKIKYPIFFILILAIFLRLSHIDFVPLWNDELYILTLISDMGKSSVFQNILSDAGNPPLFFMLSNFWLKYFNSSVFLIRLLPLIIGVFQVYLIYFILMKIYDKKIALISAFLSSINIFIILESNEIRCYILAMALVLIELYCFIKLKNDYSKKYLILYTIFSILLINTHYYCILYVLSNFILGLFLFKKHIKSFIFSNFLAFLTFVPYFLNTFIKSSTNPNFNTWIEKPTLDVINNHIIFYFGNIIFFLITIVLIFVLYKKIDKNKRFLFIYNIYSISFVFVCAFVVSFIVKPILFERYFCIFLPLFIINTSILLTIDFKTKYKYFIIFSIFLFSINMPKYENYNIFSNINLMMDYSYLDSKKVTDYNIFYVIPDRIEYKKYFKNFDNIQKDKIIVSNYGTREDIDLLKIYKEKIDTKNKKYPKTIIYLPEICVNSKIKYSKNLNIRRIETTMVPVYKIYID